jgi:hypothetical protein
MSFVRFAADAVSVQLGVNFSAPVPIVGQDDCAASFPNIQ